MIEAINGLGVGDTFQIAQLHTGNSGAAPVAASQPDVARFDAAMNAAAPAEAPSTAATVSGPAGTGQVAQAGQPDSWVIPATAAPSAETAAPSLQERLVGGITDLRESTTVIETSLHNMKADDMSPGRLLSLFADVTAANVTIHMVSREVSGLINKVDGLLKAG